MLIEARRDKELELLKMDQSREEEKSGLQNRSLDINPADRVERPRKEQFVGSTYNQEELENLFETVKGDPSNSASFLQPSMVCAGVKS